MRDAVRKAGIEMEVDSAGTGAWHTGDPPDARMTAAAAQRGIDLSEQSARQVNQEDFRRFTHIFAMDGSNLENLQAMQPTDATAELQLFLGEDDVPDPYYGGADGFEHVLDLVQSRTAILLDILAH